MTPLPTLVERIGPKRLRVALVVAAACGPAALIADFAVRAVGSALGDDRGGITLSQYDSIRVGQGEAVVESRLGRPLTQQDVEYPDPPSGDDCIYYFDSNGMMQGGSTFRFCFRGGVLEFKDGSGADFSPASP